MGAKGATVCSLGLLLMARRKTAPACKPSALIYKGQEIGINFCFSDEVRNLVKTRRCVSGEKRESRKREIKQSKISKG